MQQASYCDHFDPWFITILAEIEMTQNENGFLAAILKPYKYFIFFLLEYGFE